MRKYHFSPEKFRQLGDALGLASGTSVLDLHSGSGEMICTWTRGHGITGVGVDLSSVFTQKAIDRCVELGVAHPTTFVHSTAEAWLDDHLHNGGDRFNVGLLRLPWVIRYPSRADEWRTNRLVSERYLAHRPRRRHRPPR